MKRKLTIFMLLCLLGTSTLFAQDYKKYYLGIGGVQSHFQDKKFSEAQFRGIGASFAFGKEKMDANKFAGFELRANVSSENPHGHSNFSNVIRPTLNLFYLKNVKENLYVGANWKVADLYLRTANGLQNNSTFMDFSSVLAAKAIYDMPVGNKHIQFGLQMGLVSIAKMRNSFAYAAPQVTLESGRFSYQNESIDSPIGGEGMVFKSFLKDFHLKTSVVYPLSKRFEVAYQWELRRYSLIKNYATVYGNHNLGIRFNFIHR